MGAEVLESAPRGAVFLRNKETGEVRSVERHGEFDELVSLRAEDGVTPIWEQTGEHDVAANAPDGVDPRYEGEGLVGSVKTVGDVEGVPDLDELEFGGPPLESELEESEPADEAPDYESRTNDDLTSEIRRRGLDVPEEGSGQAGRVLKKDLVKVLEDNDKDE
jgi:hypothetical protein